MKRRLTVLAIVIMVLTCAVMAIAGCEKPEPVKAGPEGGAYYCVEEDSYRITLEDDNKFTFKVAGEDRTGKYTLAATTLTLTFGENEQVEAKLTNYNELTFTYKGKDYRFLREKEFTVKFESNGGSEVRSQSVKNGKKAKKPESPSKANNVFVGWYKDTGLTEAYDFDSAVVEDTTVYAKYIEAISNPPEYTISFAGEGINVRPMETQGGIVDINKVTVPTRADDEFLGWYVSASNERSKLTYKYEFDKLYENTTLYGVWKSELDGAPEVSVRNGKISWSGEGATVRIKEPSGNEFDATGVSGNEYEMSLGQEGEYEITVTEGEKSTKVYYTYKGLHRVSIFKVEGNDIQFNRVANAKEYELTITAKDGDHTVSTEIELDDENNVGHYNFGNYDIPVGGYVFKVAAKASGYASSLSDGYVYNRVLDKIGNITIDEATQTISWGGGGSVGSDQLHIEHQR